MFKLVKVTAYHFADDLDSTDILVNPEKICALMYDKENKKVKIALEYTEESLIVSVEDAYKLMGIRANECLLEELCGSN